MKKLWMICSWALLWGGCESESNAVRDTEKPAPPLSVELSGKIEKLNAELSRLKILADAVAQSQVRSIAETEAEYRFVFRDGAEVTVVCDEAAEFPLIGIAADGDAYYWTLAAQPGTPWLCDAVGAKLPVAGPIPVVGRDEEGFWTVATENDAVPWRIVDASGDPLEATGDESVALFRAVRVEESRVDVELTDGGILSAVRIRDLSAAGTANCYVVTASGPCVLQAGVRGNGFVAGGGFEAAIAPLDDLTADWLWTDAEGLVSEVAFDAASGDLFFTAGSGRGNASVALMHEDEVVWSWHIWVTDAPQPMTYENGAVFMDRNLGAVESAAGSTNAYGLYYQWGRKDPFYFGLTTETSAEAFREALARTTVNPAYAAHTWNFDSHTATAAEAAAHPLTFYNAQGTVAADWLSSSDATLWGEAKTLNDPCPPGYKVPSIGAWENLSSGRNYVEEVSAWDAEHFGMTYTYGGHTAWYPAQGYRNYSSGAIVGLRSSTGGSGAYWSSSASGAKARYLFFKKPLSSGSGALNPDLDKERSYGYTVRCCRE